jgi:membrane fusion protein
MSKNNNLFRKEFIDHKEASFVGKVIITTPLTFKFLVFIFGIIGIIIIIFVFHYDFTKKVKVMGQLLPENGLIKIYSSQSGNLKNIFIKENELVKKNQNILEISNSLFLKNNNFYDSIYMESKSRGILISTEIQKIKIIYDYKIKGLENDIINIQKNITSTHYMIENIKQKIDISLKSYERFRELYKENAVSLEDFEAKKNSTIDLKNQLSTLSNEYTSLQQSLSNKKIEIDIAKNQKNNDISQLKRQLSSIEQEKIQNKINSSSFIQSPIDGKVSAININKGQTVDINRILVTIIPKNKKLICLLYLQSNAIGFVKPGADISIRYLAFPYQKFGLAKAKVISISESPIPYQELNTLGVIPLLNVTTNEPMYIIKASIEKQSITAYGNEIPLKSGMLLEADINLDTRKIYEWILEPLYTVSGKI